MYTKYVFQNAVYEAASRDLKATLFDIVNVTEKQLSILREKVYNTSDPEEKNKLIEIFNEQQKVLLETLDISKSLASSLEKLDDSDRIISNQLGIEVVNEDVKTGEDKVDEDVKDNEIDNVKEESNDNSSVEEDNIVPDTVKVDDNNQITNDTVSEETQNIDESIPDTNPIVSIESPEPVISIENSEPVINPEPVMFDTSVVSVDSSLEPNNQVMQVEPVDQVQSVANTYVDTSNNQLNNNEPVVMETPVISVDSSNSSNPSDTVVNVEFDQIDLDDDDNSIESSNIINPVIDGQADNNNPSIVNPVVNSQVDNNNPSIVNPVVNNQVDNNNLSTVNPVVNNQVDSNNPSIVNPVVNSQTDNNNLSTVNPVVNSQVDNNNLSTVNPVVNSQVDNNASLILKNKNNIEPKNILISKIQGGKLRDSYQPQIDLLNSTGFFQNSNISNDAFVGDITEESLIANGVLPAKEKSIEEQIEEMMEEANKLYNAGKVEEAQKMYENISIMNKQLQDGQNVMAA